MDGERWWIVDEIARWWREATEEQRGVLMQRAVEGTKEATLAEVRKGAIVAEIDASREDLAREAKSQDFIRWWSAGERKRGR